MILAVSMFIKDKGAKVQGLDRRGIMQFGCFLQPPSNSVDYLAIPSLLPGTPPLLHITTEYPYPCHLASLL